MVAGMVADDIYHGCVAALGVVEIGQSVAHAGAEMQQGAGWLSGHAGITVGGAGGDALEQAQDRTHALDPVEGGDHVHFRGAGIGETDLHPLVDQGAHQAFRCEHRLSSSRYVFCGPVSVSCARSPV